jgi:hypothetical protein
MRTVNLPKTTLLQGWRIRLAWDTLANLDGWYAEVNPRYLRQLERDPHVHMEDVQQELQAAGDYVRYGQDSAGHSFLCVYKRA